MKSSQLSQIALLMRNSQKATDTNKARYRAALGGTLQSHANRMLAVSRCRRLRRCEEVVWSSTCQQYQVYCGHPLRPRTTAYPKIGKQHHKQRPIDGFAKSTDTTGHCPCFRFASSGVPPSGGAGSSCCVPYSKNRWSLCKEGNSAFSSDRRLQLQHARMGSVYEAVAATQPELTMRKAPKVV